MKLILSSKLISFFLMVISVFSALGQTTGNAISLNGSWLLIDIQDLDTMSATVPGCIHTDLLSNDKIPDPFYRNNEHELQYLEKKDWVYKRSFEVDQELFGFSKLELVCEGLDTYASIKINGKEIGETANMFRKYRFNLKPHLHLGLNTIEISFTSPFNKLEEKVKSYGYVLPADNEKGDFKYGPFCRKAAYQFGWDWGPRLPTIGIWKDIYIEASSGLYLEDYSVQTISCNDQRAELLLKTIIYSEENFAIEISIPNNLAEVHNLHQGKNELLDTFIIRDPNLWWPNGRGDAFLYHKKIQIKKKEDLVIDQDISFGIRKIELINEKDDIGTSFYFKINGESIFAKGANYIPQDIFPSRVKDWQYRKLLQQAKDANMNMIRVWGGGIYEKDIFYELCDSLGLMVWQDFMFAGTMYPIDKSFKEEVKEEINYQINRLSKHPSLAIWCGNNEIEVAWNNWGWQEKYNYNKSTQKKLWNNYKKLFKREIPNWIAENNCLTAYTHTSPLSNWGKAENFNHGSMHYWGVWHGRDSIESFKENVGRFMSEYGMQGYPEMSTIKTFAAEEDWSLDSDVMKNRQKSYIGNGEILRLLKLDNKTPEDFNNFILLSQEQQAYALKIAIEAHINSGGHCMGSLLWQLNDCWPGPSWSIIDYYGNPKKAYKEVRAAFKDIKR